LAKFDLKEYAKRGAAARAAELRAELEQIYRAFPGIRVGSARSKRDSSGNDSRRRRPRRMSAAQRRAVSARMKKYWAARRKQNAASK
jgi:hypothetical protein